MIARTAVGEGAPATARSRRRRPVRDAVVGATSLSILVAMALFVISPSRLTYATEISTTSIDSRGAVVQGRLIDTTARGIARATLVLRERMGATERTASWSRTGTDGRFRITSLPPGVYSLSVRVPAEGARVGVHDIRIERGERAEIVVRQVDRPLFFFLPIWPY